MQYKSQEAAMQARSLDGQGKSHPRAPESDTYGPGARSTTPVNTAAAGNNLAGATLSERVAAAKRSVEEISDAVVARVRKNAGAADDYVHAQPWKFIGVGAATGLVLGLLLARRR